MRIKLNYLNPSQVLRFGFTDGNLRYGKSIARVIKIREIRLATSYPQIRILNKPKWNFYIHISVFCYDTTFEKSCQQFMKVIE